MKFNSTVLDVTFNYRLFAFQVFSHYCLKLHPQVLRTKKIFKICKHNIKTVFNICRAMMKFRSLYRDGEKCVSIRIIDFTWILQLWKVSINDHWEDEMILTFKSNSSKRYMPPLLSFDCKFIDFTRLSGQSQL